jgi:hypothetical protein
VLFKECWQPVWTTEREKEKERERERERERESERVFKQGDTIATISLPI